MVCPKCAGLMVYENVVDFFSPKNMARCLQCGMILDSVVWSNRQRSIADGAEVVPLLSEVSMSGWRKQVKAARARAMEGRKQENDPMIFLDGEIDELLYL